MEELGKSGRCQRLRRLMDVRRRVWSSRGNSVLRHRGVSYLLRAVLRAINKLYYTSHDVFHESFIGGALWREARVDTPHSWIYSQADKPIVPRIRDLESCSYYAQREIILKYAWARNASTRTGIGYNFVLVIRSVHRLEMERDNRWFLMSLLLSLIVSLNARVTLWQRFLLFITCLHAYVKIA